MYTYYLPLHGRYLARGSNATVFTNLLLFIYITARPGTLPVALTPPLPLYQLINVPVMSYTYHLPLHGRYLARGSNATVFNQSIVCMYHCTARYLARGSNATVNSIPFCSIISGISHCLCYDTIIGYLIPAHGHPLCHCSNLVGLNTINQSVPSFISAKLAASIVYPTLTA